MQGFCGWLQGEISQPLRLKGLLRSLKNSTPLVYWAKDPQDALPTPLDAYLLMKLSNNLGDESDEDDEVEQEGQ